MLSGPNFIETSVVAEESPFPVIASGGVRNLEDLIELEKIQNLKGAICGVSLYEKSLNLRDALSRFNKL